MTKFDNEKMKEAMSIIMDSFTKRQNEKLEEKFKGLELEINLKRPEEFYFKYLYGDGANFEDFAVAKINELARPHNPRYGILFFHYEEIEYYVSEFFRRVNGPTCCVDKGRHVVKHVLKRLLTGKREYINARGSKGYWGPVYNDSDHWFDFVMGHPLLKKDPVSHSMTVLEIYKKLNGIKILEEDYCNEFLRFLKNSPDIDKTLVINSNGWDLMFGGKKEVALGELIEMNMNLMNKVYFIKSSYPHFKKIYKHSKEKNNGKN